MENPLFLRRLTSLEIFNDIFIIMCEWFTLEDGQFPEVEFVDQETGEKRMELQRMALSKIKKIPIDYSIDIQKELQGLAQINITEDGLVQKYIIEEAVNDAIIDETSTVRVKCDERMLDGTLVSSGANRNNVFKINLSGQIQPGMKKAFMTMFKGEKAWVRIAGKWLYINEEDQKQATENQARFFRIEMVDFEIHRKLDPMNKQDRFEQIEQFRVLGGKSFVERNWASALSAFKKGYNFVRWWPKKVELTSEEEKENHELQVLFSGNVGQVYMEQKNFTRALQVLSDMKSFMRLSKYEAKNYFRIAKCQLLLDEPEQALRTLTEANGLCQIDPEEAECFKQLQNQCLDKVQTNETQIIKKLKKTN